MKIIKLHRSFNIFAIMSAVEDAPMDFSTMFNYYNCKNEFLLSEVSRVMMGSKKTLSAKRQDKLENRFYQLVESQLRIKSILSEIIILTQNLPYGGYAPQIQNHYQSRLERNYQKAVKKYNKVVRIFE